MVILNTTYIVEERSAKQWEQWVKQTFIASIISEQKTVTDARLFHVIADTNTEGKSYSFQLTFNSIPELEAFATGAYHQFAAVMDKKFPGEFLLFQSVLKSC